MKVSDLACWWQMLTKQALLLSCLFVMPAFRKHKQRPLVHVSHCHIRHLDMVQTILGVARLDQPLILDAGTAAQQPFDETAAANPEEIELDDLDEDGNEEAVQDAEAAKQELGQDNGMFHSEELHDFDPASASLATDATKAGTTTHDSEMSAALA